MTPCTDGMAPCTDGMTPCTDGMTPCTDDMTRCTDGMTPFTAIFVVRQIPRKLVQGSYEALANHLIKSCHTDLERVRALFKWSLRSFKYDDIDSDAYNNDDVEAFPLDDTPLYGLRGIKREESNHAHFFARLSRYAVHAWWVF